MLRLLQTCCVSCSASLGGLPNHEETCTVFLDAYPKLTVLLFLVPPLTAYPNPPSATTSETWSDNISLALQLSKTWLDLQVSSGDKQVSPGDKQVSPGVTNGNHTTKLALPFQLPDTFLRGNNH